MGKEEVKRQDRFWSFFGRRHSAFTLTEVIIVVSIISFLVLLGMTYLRSQVFKGNDARRKADIRKIQVAVEEYEKDRDCYPPSNLLVCEPGESLKPYINKIPCDPVTDLSYNYEPAAGACPAWYLLYAKLDNEQDEDIIPDIGPSGADNYYAGSANAPTPAPGGGGGGGGGSDFWGCKSGVCTPLSGQTECSPNYTNSDCSGQCGSPQTECTPM